jgi:uncharacterized protein (TIGR02453 family)
MPKTKSARTATRKPAARFQGFAREAPGFFHRLAAEMTREWFTAHKAEYEALWVAPLTQLMEDIAAAIKPVYRGLTVQPPKIFRIHRDVRFAKDKSPYKTHAAAMLAVTKGRAKAAADGEGSSTVAIYLHLGADEEYSGAGQYMFSPAAMIRWRKLVAAPKTGGELAKLIGAATARGLTVEGHDSLARVPKPYDPEHPRGELLRYKGLLVGFPDIPRGLIHRPDFAKWLAERATESAPIVRWLANKVA